MTPGVSLHLMTKNPPMDRLAALIAFVQPYVREAVIVNTGMPDEDRRTIETWSRQIGIESEVVVVDADFTDFSTTRNKGLEHHRYEWTLVLDTDELPSAAMMAHVALVTGDQNTNPDAVGYLYYTFGWENGRHFESVPHDWHVRLFRTEGSYFFRAVHELVAIGGRSEIDIRRTPKLPMAPSAAYLIHSYHADPESIRRKTALYTELGTRDVR